MSSNALAHGSLPTLRSLRGSSAAAAARAEPLVVMTSLKGCVFCDVVRDHHLGPMQRSGAVHAVQMDIQDRSGQVQDFSAQLVSPYELSRRWNARFAPTVLFFGPDGQELTERLVGVAVPDFYGDYLSARLEQARKRLR